MISAIIISYVSERKTQNFIWHVTEFFELIGVEVCLKPETEGTGIKFRYADTLNAAIVSPEKTFMPSDSLSLKENMTAFLKMVHFSEEEEVLSLLDFTFEAPYYKYDFYLNHFVVPKNPQDFLDKVTGDVVKPLFAMVQKECKEWDDKHVPRTKFAALKMMTDIDYYGVVFLQKYPRYDKESVIGICFKILQEGVYPLPGIWRLIITLHFMDHDVNKAYEYIFRYQDEGFKNSPFANCMKGRYWKDEVRDKLDKALIYYQENEKFLGNCHEAQVKILQVLKKQRKDGEVITVGNDFLKKFRLELKEKSITLMDFDYFLNTLFYVAFAEYTKGMYGRALEDAEMIKEGFHKTDKIWLPEEVEKDRKWIIRTFLESLPISEWMMLGNSSMGACGLAQFWKLNDFLPETSE